MFYAIKYTNASFSNTDLQNNVFLNGTHWNNLWILKKCFNFVTVTCNLCKNDCH